MQKLQLTIPEPCHENWQQMTPTQQGRFCNACAKEVVDFSMMTDTEVLNYFTTLTPQKVCGRALPSQLNRSISRPKEPKKRLFWYWNYLVMFFMLFSKSNAVKAQGQLRPLTERSPVKPYEHSKDQVNIMSQTKAGSRVVTGKVTDVDGNPVSFASIRIKGTPTGLSADANGKYSIRVNNGDILIILGANFATTETPVGIQETVSTVLGKGTYSGLTELVVAYAGKLSYRDMSESEDIAKHAYVALLRVKDDQSGLPISKAQIILLRKDAEQSDTVLTNSKGLYGLNLFGHYGHVYIKVDAAGFESNEFEIRGREISKGKKEWEVLLTKQKTDQIKPVGLISGKETAVRLGSISAVSIAKSPLYLVDGTVVPNGNEINPDDIEDISVLQGPAATALLGTDASNGAILITTRKAKVKTMDTVAIKVNVAYSAKGLMGAVIPGIRISKYTDLKARVSTLFADSLKIFPNPVQRGSAFSLALKLKQTGNHYLQVTDAAGTIVLQKQVHALVKEYKETIPADVRWGAGVYHIRVFDNKNKLVSKSSFIVR
jgi:TonB-dependent SusC/RagA subfamily outer membrane receptor